MTDKAILKQLFDAHATLEFVSYKKCDKCTITTYRITSIDYPVEFDDDDCVEVYDKGAQIKLFEYIGKTKFFKHCSLVAKEFKGETNYVAAKVPAVVLQPTADLDAN